MDKRILELTDHINVRMTDREGTALRQLAEALGLSLSELVRVLIARGLEGIMRPEGSTNAHAR